MGWVVICELWVEWMDGMHKQFYYAIYVLSVSSCCPFRTQIPACLAAETPGDCPEKKAGLFCSSNRSGIFHVAGRPIVLHVGPNVKNALSCMIQADAVLMGCSTFGQIAGLLSKGISLFSTDCGGNYTPSQYKLTPPLAVAERGYLWVPIAGSWRDPVLTSTKLLRGALDELIATRSVSRV